MCMHLTDEDHLCYPVGRYVVRIERSRFGWHWSLSAPRWFGVERSDRVFSSRAAAKADADVQAPLLEREWEAERGLWFRALARVKREALLAQWVRPAAVEVA